MATKALLTVAEAILDSAAEEYRDANLANIEGVQAYAENGMNVQLSDTEAHLIMYVCKEWLSLPQSPWVNGNYYYHIVVERPLNNYDEIEEIDSIVAKEPKSESDLIELAGALNRAAEINKEEEDDNFVTVDYSDLPLDDRCRFPQDASDLWSWADPDGDGVPKYVLLHDNVGDIGWYVSEVCDDSVPRTRWAKEG